MQQLNTEITNHINGDEMDKMSLFIKKNQKFYQEKFSKMDATGKSMSWNWPAFFFGIYWMVYRKMYFKAAAFFVLILVASYTPYIGVVLNLAVSVGIAIYANALYKDHVEEYIKKIDESSPEDKEEIIIKKGGTNLPLSMIIGIVHQLLAILLLAGILGMSM